KGRVPPCNPDLQSCGLKSGEWRMSNAAASAVSPLQPVAGAISGQVKWFDLTKGYGFIRPDDGSEGDILLHQTCVRQSGFKTAYEGAMVVCEVMMGARGRQASRLLSLDNSTAQIVPRTAPRIVRYVAEPRGPVLEATVKWFN